MRPIDADALIAKMPTVMDMQDTYLPIHFKEWLIDTAPSIDIEPKRGEWKIEETKSVWGKGYMLTCSECGDTFRVTENALSHEHFCRNCGADMRKESDR